MNGLDAKYVIPEEESHSDEEVQSFFSVIVTATYYDYMMYVNIFISMVLLLCFIVVLQSIREFKEIRLQAMLGFKYLIFLKRIFKNSFLNLLLPYALATLIISYIYYPSITNLMYILSIIVALIIIIILFISIMTLFIYNNISRRVLYSFSNTLIIVVSTSLVIFSAALIYASANVVSNISFSNIQTSNSDYLSEYYMIPHDFSLNFEEHDNISKYLIESSDAIYTLYGNHSENKSSKKYLEVDYMFFERNKQIKFADGREIDYFELKESLKPTQEQINRARTTLPDGLSEEEIANIITPIPVFYTSNTGSFKDVTNLSETRGYMITDDNSKYHTFDEYSGDISLDEVNILMKERDFYVSNIFVRADSLSEAQEKVEAAYNYFDLECNVRVTHTNLNTHYEGAIESRRDSLLAFIVGMIGLVTTVLIYLELILNKHKSKIMLTTICGFKNHVVKKQVNYELFVTNVIVACFVIFTTPNKFAIITFVMIVLLEVVVAHFKVNKFINSNLVNYLKGELQGD